MSVFGFDSAVTTSGHYGVSVARTFIPSTVTIVTLDEILAKLDQLTALVLANTMLIRRVPTSNPSYEKLYSAIRDMRQLNLRADRGK